MKYIRQAFPEDVYRIAEIIITNYRVNFYSFFQDDDYYYKELNVRDMAVAYAEDAESLENTYVYDDDGIVKGIMKINGREIEKLFVELQFQNQGIGAKLLKFAVEMKNAEFLLVLEYNKRAIGFYERNGFVLTGEKIIEDDCVPLLKMSKMATSENETLALNQEEVFMILDEGHLSQIAELYKNAFGCEPWNDDWSNAEQLTEYIKEISCSYHALNFGLFINGKLTALSIGMIRHWWEGTNYNIEEFCVSPDMQGKNIGSRFMAMIENDIKSRGLSGIFLQTDSDKPSYHFYQKNGFKELDFHVSFYKKLK